MENLEFGTVIIVDDNELYRAEIVNLLRQTVGLDIAEHEYGQNGAGLLAVLRRQYASTSVVVIMQKVRGKARIVAQAIQQDPILKETVSIIYIDCVWRTDDDILAKRLPVKINGSNLALPNLTPQILQSILRDIASPSPAADVPA